MTHSDVREVVMAALQEAQAALGGAAAGLSIDACPFDVIPGFDSLASVEVTTTICEQLGITDTDANPFLQDGAATVGQVIAAFCALAAATETGHG
jgi:hypothetical protein